MSKDERWYVHVIPYDVTLDKPHVLGKERPLTKREAEKVDSNMQRNMNHDRFYTLMSPSEEADPLTGRPLKS